MDFKRYICVVLLSVLIFTHSVTCLSLSLAKTAEKAVLGPNVFEISCTYQLVPGEFLSSISLARKSLGESTFAQIASFPGPEVGQNATLTDPGGSDLVGRSMLTTPTDGSPTAKLVFNEIRCNDAADYSWVASYLVNGLPSTFSKNHSFLVQVNTRFNEEGGATLSYTPNTSIAEGDDITFTCEGDVGKDPTGQLKWYYYLNNVTSQVYDITEGVKDENPTEVASTCSNRRKSTLQLRMTKDFNNIIVRCTVQQFTYDQFGEGHKQTRNIPVFYSPRINRIDRAPSKVSYFEMESVTLTCVGEGNPDPSFHWQLPDNSTVDGPILELINITVEQMGTYTCIATNTFLLSNRTTNQTVTLDIRETPPPTTSTTPSPTDSTIPGQPTKGPIIGKDDDNTTTYIIVGVVVGVVLFIIIVVALICIKKQQKPKEIEEPPEKPRNNQGLFYGNRPDLVSADHNSKNHGGSTGLNSSFNNSFDSSSDTKLRNDDGLLYIDLQFDNKPGSRRPINIVDNMGGDGGVGTPYADIVNPRV